MIDASAAVSKELRTYGAAHYGMRGVRLTINVTLALQFTAPQIIHHYNRASRRFFLTGIGKKFISYI